MNDVPNPEKPGEMIEHGELEANPGLVEGLPKDFRAVAVSGGDNVSVAIGSNGLVKAWGSFHVRSSRPISYCVFLRSLRLVFGWIPWVSKYCRSREEASDSHHSSSTGEDTILLDIYWLKPCCWSHY